MGESTETERIDPGRSMRLLWGLETGRRRGPKPSLSIDEIVATAIGIADEEGIDALSMRRLGERLGVGAMTIYTYVQAKSDLLDLMYDRVVGEAYSKVMDEIAAGNLSDWRLKLEAIARDRWEIHQRHHWFIRVPWTRPPLGPNVLDAYEKAVTVLTGIGLTGREITDILTLVSAYVDGAARMAVEAITLPTATSIDDNAWWEAVAPVLDQVWDAARFPTLSGPDMASAWEQPAEEGTAGYFLTEAVISFEFGLERLLDGVAAFVNRKRSNH